MGVVGDGEVGGWRGETGVGVGVGGDVEAEVVAGVFVVVGGGMEVEGGVEEVVLGRVWDGEGEVVGVELGGEDARSAVDVEVVGVVADFVDVSVEKRTGCDDERTVSGGVAKLGAEYGGVEAGAVLAGRLSVVDDHGREERGDVGAGRENRVNPERGCLMLSSAYEIHLPPYPAG